MSTTSPCPNCGNITDGCFFPPSFGGGGFFTCKPSTERKARLAEIDQKKLIEQSPAHLERCRLIDSDEVKMRFNKAIDPQYKITQETEASLLALDEGGE